MVRRTYSFDPFDEAVVGLDYDKTTGILSLTSGYTIPTTAQVTAWNALGVIGTDVQAYDAGLLSLAGLGEPLGDEELVDSGFDDAGEWTGPDWDILASVASKLTGTGEDTLSEVNPFTVTSGAKYKVVLGIQTIDSQSPVQVDLGGDSSEQFITTGTKTFYLDTINTNSLAIIGNTSIGVGIALSSISIKKIGVFVKVTATDTYALRTPSEVRTDLGLVIGTDVQPWKDRTSVTSSPYSVSASDEHISVTTASVAITLNFPAITDGVIYHVKDQDGNSSGNNITLSPNGSDTIENAASLTINTNGASVTLMGNSTTNNWEIQ